MHAGLLYDVRVLQPDLTSSSHSSKRMQFTLQILIHRPLNQTPLQHSHNVAAATLTAQQQHRAV